MVPPNHFLLTSVVCATIISARTADAAEPDPREVAAKRRCLAGDVQAGVSLLADLYVDTNDATYIRNQARCFQQNGRTGEAILRFREYLRKARDLDAEERREVEGYLRELQAEQDRKAAQASAPVTAPPVAPSPPALVARPEPAERGSSSLRMAGIGLGATGLVFVGVGAYFGLQVRSIEQRVAQTASDHNIDDRSERARGQRAVRWQWLGYGLGAAALAAGTTLFMLGRPDSHEGSRGAIALSPLIDQDGGGACVHWGF
jgi:hypothetical protein